MNIAMKWLQWMNVITCNDTDSSENGLSGYLAKQLEMHLKNELKESSNLVFYTQSTIAVTSGWVKESKLARKRSQLKDLLMWGPPHWPQWHHQLQIHSCLPLPLSFCAHCCLTGEPVKSLPLWCHWTWKLLDWQQPWWRLGQGVQRKAGSACPWSLACCWLVASELTKGLWWWCAVKQQTRMVWLGHKYIIIIIANSHTGLMMMVCCEAANKNGMTESQIHYNR